MERRIHTQPLTTEAFSDYGEVLEATGAARTINQGKCSRFHDLASLEFDGAGATAGISLFLSEKRSLPYQLDMVERHPLGSQAFIPMALEPFLVIVCPDLEGRPGEPQAFVTSPGQGINFFKNTWHGVLTPLSDPGLFAVVDRIGDGENLEEFWFDEPYLVVSE